MNETFTVDASVFVSAFSFDELGHEESSRLLVLCKERGVQIFAPALLLSEVAASISRGCDDTRLALQLVDLLAFLPHLKLITVDKVLAQQSAHLAATQRIRGCDAIYVGVALRFDCPLVTRDREQRERAAAVVPAHTPAEVLVQWSEAGQ